MGGFWFVEGVGGQMHVYVKNFDAYFEAQKLYFCDFWFVKGVGSQMYVDFELFICILKP